MDFESLGDRMKYYEGYNNDKFPPNLPVMVRIDGKGFHNYTKGFKRPFDSRLHYAMDFTAKTLLEKTHARVAYTQSDEISLVYTPGKIYFDGKPQKICSVLASMATYYFNQCMVGVLKAAFFDCRTFFLPSLEECVNCLIWREQDAVRNSIQMVARSVFSHKECENKSCSELQDMLHTQGVNWNNFEQREKRGEYFIRKTIEKKLSDEDLKDLPEKHEARKNPDIIFSRTVVISPTFMKLSSVESPLIELFGENNEHTGF